MAESNGALKTAGTSLASAAELRLLLVEDNPGDADLIARMLKENGIALAQIQHVRLLSEAIEQLKKQPVDAIILDLGLPDSVGLDTLRAVRVETLEVAVLVLTGLDDDQVGLAAVAEGAEDYLVKGMIDGRVLVRELRYAVERKRNRQQLRESERFLHASMDALSAHIAILDQSGAILFVNEAWRAFAAKNDIDLECVSEGANYLAVCDGATNEDAEMAKCFAERIREVLSGKLLFYEMEYPCHSPYEQRWFIVRVTSFQGDGSRYAAIAHENITERKQAEEALCASEEQYRHLFESASDAFLLIDIDTDLVIDANRIASELYGYDRDELLTKMSTDLSAEPEETQLRIHESQAIPDQVLNIPLRLHRKKDGTVFPVEITARSLSVKGRLVLFVAVRDITERKRAEAAFALNSQRVQALLQLNQMTQASLQEITDFGLEEAVRLTRSTIGYLAFLNEDESVLTMHAWSHSAMAECAIVDKPIVYPVASTGLWGEAVRQRKAVITNDYAADNPLKKTYPKGHVLVKRHMNIPVFAGSRIVLVAGVGNKAEEYDQDDVRQLTLLMEGMWRLIERMRAQEELRVASLYARNLIEASLDPLVTINSNGKITDVNNATEQVTGVLREILIGSDFSDYFTEPDKAREGYQQVFSQGIVKDYPLTIRHASGHTTDVLYNASVYKTEAGEVQGIFATARDVTERKRAEETLRDNELKYRALFETADDAILLFADDQWIDCNAGALRVFGCTRDQIIGAHPKRFSPPTQPDGRSSEEEAIKKINLAYAVEPQFFEWEHCRADGTPFSAEVRLNRLDLGGKPHMQAIVRDVTQRKRVEEALVASEERFRVAAQCSSDLIYERDMLTGQAQFFGDIDGHLGYTPGAFPRSLAGWMEYIYPEDLSRVMEILQETLLHRTPYSIEYRLRRGDGTYADWSDYGVVIWDAAGNPIKNVGAAKDVTRRKRAEEALRIKNLVFDDAMSANSIADLNGVITETNETFVRVWGFSSRDEVIGKPIPFFLNDQNEAEVLITALNNIGHWEGDYTGKKKDGAPFIVHSLATTITDKAGTVIGYQSACMDVTEQKSLEEQYRQAQKMEAIGQLAGGVAHDFNNILQSMAGYSSFLLDRLPEQDETHEFAEEIALCVDRAAALTRQLLAFSRRQILEMEDLDLNEVVHGITKMIGRIIGEDVEVEVMKGRRLGNVLADQGQMEQVLLNLCINARDAMPDGGTVTIETENVVMDKEYCDAHAWASPGQYVLLSVTDTGCGMDAEIQARIFEPFFTTKELGKGTGLGLATVYGIVRQHQGMIQVYSEVGKGTTFKVYLPSFKRTASTVGAKIVGRATGGNETILLAEDDATLRKLAVRILESAGYTVLLAANGKEALDVFEKHAADINLCLLDVVMPKMGGKAVYDALRQQHPRLRFLFSSGYSANAIHTNFILRGDIELIQKPYAPDALLRKVREVLDGVGTISESDHTQEGDTK